MTELTGKVAIVTGASRRRGVGRALAVSLAQAGADVVVTGAPGGGARLTRDELDAGWRGVPSVVEQVESLGVRGLALSVDIRSADDVERMVSDTVRTLGRLDILVNNAAYPRASDRVPLTELPEETWRNIIDVNLTGWKHNKHLINRRFDCAGNVLCLRRLKSGRARTEWLNGSGAGSPRNHCQHRCSRLS